MLMIAQARWNDGQRFAAVCYYLPVKLGWHVLPIVTSSNGNIFRVTGPLCGDSPATGEFPSQRQVTRSFDVLIDLRPNKRLSKHSKRWWFETQ